VPSPLIATITSTHASIRDRSLDQLLAGLSTSDVLAACAELEQFRRQTQNLYERVRASMFLHAIYRYRLQESADLPPTGTIPYDAYVDLLERRFEQAIARLHSAAGSRALTSALASALAHAYAQSTFQTLADQVRRSVRSCAGNRWFFRVGSPDEHPIRIQPQLLARDPSTGLFPLLVEQTPVRLDLSHSGWSDIFFLGMDYPEGARVLNISVDLGVHGRDAAPRPPIESYVRVITEPVIRLTSIDLGDCKDVSTLDELFNFGNDYLGLVKAAVIASGVVPPSLEGTGWTIEQILAHVIRPGHGLEVVSKVNDIPKGSRLAVSTNLLASLVSVLMRATGQARNLTGPLQPDEARVVVARAILGEWLGGSGGGWQDSGGIFPGVKLIHGMVAGPDDPEWQVSRGRLMPDHEILDTGAGQVEHRAAGIADTLSRSLVLVHGGMAQNVGPILNMVTEKYLLRRENSWKARGQALGIFNQIVDAVNHADVPRIASLTQANWDGPLKSIIPWVTNAFTERLIREARAEFGADFWGFLMLGGMSGGGMGFFVDPGRRAEFVAGLERIMARAKTDLDDALPFAMNPVVYDFAVNPRGTIGSLREGPAATLPSRYYNLQVPRMIAGESNVDDQRRRDLLHFAASHPDAGELVAAFRTTLHHLFPLVHSAGQSSDEWNREAETIKRGNGFDSVQHARMREDYLRGRIDLSRNRLPVDTDIRDVDDADLIHISPNDEPARRRGEDAIRRGEVAVVTLAAGVGSRWTTGAGVVKAVNPFISVGGLHRSFLEIHLAKTRLSQRRYAAALPHAVTTSFLTHAAIARHLERCSRDGDAVRIWLSPGQSIGQRLVPTVRSLVFLWEETPHEILDENKQKVRDASRRAILDWARARGEASDYTDNLPLQRFNPPGHFYEIPNMLRNGSLVRLLEEYPNLRWLLVHNVDTLGADVDPAILGRVIDNDATLTFEVVPRRIDDHGGGLARVNGRLRLLEGLAMPREEAEFQLRFYNTLTTWVRIDALLQALCLTRSDLKGAPEKVAAAGRAIAARVPTYVTIKDVKRRWGHGQEDVFPVAQFERLWGDLTALPELSCAFLAVDRRRGQQLKDPAQLDGWANDGSAQHVNSLCLFPESETR
jgi:galactokinase/mevalonate kinase-like predicted kinase